jgi:hypothetical protein
MLKSCVFWDLEPCGSARTDVSEERVIFIFTVEIISKLVTELARTSELNLSTLKHNYSEDSLKQNIGLSVFSKYFSAEIKFSFN